MQILSRHVPSVALRMYVCPSRRSRNRRLCLTQILYEESTYSSSCGGLLCCLSLTSAMPLVSDCKWGDATRHAKPVRSLTSSLVTICFSKATSMSGRESLWLVLRCSPWSTIFGVPYHLPALPFSLYCLYGSTLQVCSTAVFAASLTTVLCGIQYVQTIASLSQSCPTLCSLQGEVVPERWCGRYIIRLLLRRHSKETAKERDDDSRAGI